MDDFNKKEMRVHNAGLYHTIRVVATNYKGWVITNIQTIGTECFKIQIREGKKGERKFKYIKARCCLTSWINNIDPDKDITIYTKEVEKIFPDFPKILIIENVGDYIVIIYEWGEGVDITDSGVNKTNAIKSYGKFLKGIENLGIYPRDNNLANIVYNSKKNFAYYCDFGAMSFYVKRGNKRYKEKAMSYKNDILKTGFFSGLREVFYAGYN